MIDAMLSPRKETQINNPNKYLLTLFSETVLLLYLLRKEISLFLPVSMPKGKGSLGERVFEPLLIHRVLLSHEKMEPVL